MNELPPPDLAYFGEGTPEFAAHWKDLKWAQSSAMRNGEIMMPRLLKVFNKSSIIVSHSNLNSQSLPPQLCRARASLRRRRTPNRLAFPNLNKLDIFLA
ncbi:MAG: RtcB family protein [Pyrinomonadaceae bacterium]|nr:RtcB family protein [Pyrinomonadaceae bacterium]